MSGAEDKKCRICGYADMKNINIFTDSQSSKLLLMKIRSVFPILLYKGDPLPKNICKKCIYNVGFMYNETQRMLKAQNKWIGNVRRMQPDHNYICILDIIKNSNATTAQSITTTFKEEISEDSINRFQLNELNEQSTKCHDMNEDSKPCSAPSKLQNQEPVKPSLDKSAKIKSIKSILELNGCSLLTVNSKEATDAPETSYTTVSIKTEPDDDTRLDLSTNDALPSCAKSATSSTSRLGPPPLLTVKCRYCRMQFNTLSDLALHQLRHLRLCMPKIFTKKYLPKMVRRGRLITLQDRKCIRCLNCWRIFVDNKSILDHWAMGDCDFYCHICGKEFAQMPKMLREHVPAAHGISYRSSKLPRTNNPVKIELCNKLSATEESFSSKELPSCSDQGSSTSESPTKCPPPIIGQSRNSKSKHKSPPSKKSSTSFYSPVSCHICFKTFNNFKACNSHMRKHKPSHLYGETVLPPHVNSKAKRDKYTVNDTTTTPAPRTVDYYGMGAKLANSSLLTISLESRPQNQMRTSSTLPRGVRTKFVSRRSDSNMSQWIRLQQNQKPSNIPSIAIKSSTQPTGINALVNDWNVPPVQMETSSIIKQEPMETNEL